MKKVGKTTRPFRYDLNQIPYDYTVEVRNRLKGLDLIDRMPDKLWTEVRDIVQETGISEFNSNDHYIYYCGQESFRRNGVALSQQESKMQYLDAISKTTASSLFISKANHSISQ